jgi:hypothetical protein
LAISNDDGEFRRERPKPVDKERIATALRLIDWQAELSRQGLDWRWFGVESSPGGAIGLSDDTRHVAGRIRSQGFEAWTG